MPSPLRHTVFMVDPSNFSIPYDQQLIQALLRTGSVKEIFFFCRHPRVNEAELRTHGDPRITVFPCFYPISERLSAFLPKSLFLVLKGLEHILGLLLVWVMSVLYEPKVVHFQWLVLPLAEKWILKLFKLQHTSRSRLVLTLHDSTPFNNAPSAKVQLNSYFDAVNEVDRVFVHTEKAKKEVMDGHHLPESKLVRIHHGLLPLQSVELTDSARHLEAELASYKPYLLLFGNMRRYKGIDELVQVFLKLSVEFPDMHLVLAGSKLDEFDVAEPFLNQSEQHPRIKVWTQYLSESELNVLLRNAGLVVFPYRFIDASGALLLAATAGVPLLATANECFVDTKAILGDALQLYPYEMDIKHPKELEKALRTAWLKHGEWGHKHSRMDESAIERSWQSTAERTMEVYEV